SPSMNFVEANATGGTLAALGATFALGARLAGHEGACVMGVRPEHLSEEPVPGGVPVRYAVELVEPLGSETYLTGSVAGARIVARVGSRTAAKPGGNIELYVDPRRLHLFAPGDNGAAIGAPEASANLPLAQSA
ncbi:MAG: TOBE domain-containing protein, partial [Myxococcales bacterium]